MRRAVMVLMFASVALVPVTAEAADTKPPQTRITAGPSGPTRDATPEFRFKSSEKKSTFKCKLDTGRFKKCTSPLTVRALGDGRHVLLIIAVDRAGNKDQTPATRSFVVDTRPPDTSIKSGPVEGSTVASTDTSFTLGATESGATFTCKLDDAPLAACGPTKQYADVADGAHTFTVRACDAAGNCDPTPATRTWTIDSTPPDTTITAGPTADQATQDDDSSFTFSANPAAGSTFECRLDEEDFVTCTSPATYADVAEGAHTFTVRACDAVGNCDATPATRTWTIDSTPPDTTITGGPTADQTTKDDDPSFSFSADPASGATFECRLDEEDFADCSSPRTYTDVAEGAHTFRVRACDAAGNCDPTPATRTWTIDTSSPDTMITAGPTADLATQDNDPSFTFTADPAAGSTFECRLDAADFAPCSSPATYVNIAEGAHTFTVRACDAVGNCDATPATRGWTVDSIAPNTQITAGPSGSTAKNPVTFTYNAFGEEATYFCSLDGGPFASCPSSGTSYFNVALNVSHTFAVRACDVAANCDLTAATRSWLQVYPTALNETDTSSEADFCNIQFPADAQISQGQSLAVFGQIFETGVTEAAGPSGQVMAQVGYGPLGSDPRSDTTSWRYFAATFNAQVSNNDEYVGTLPSPPPGSHRYTVRFSLDGGESFTYCDTNGAGSNGGLTYSPNDLGTLTVS